MNFELTDEDLENYLEENGDVDIPSFRKKSPIKAGKEAPTENTKEKREKEAYERKQKVKEMKEKESITELSKKINRNFGKKKDEQTIEYSNSSMTWILFLERHASNLSPSEIKAVAPLMENLYEDNIMDILDILQSNDIPFNERISILSKTVKNPEELYRNHPKLQKARDSEKIELRALTEKQEVTEGFYTCKRCGSKKTMARQKQTRSADEPMTEFVTCQSCGLKWRVG